MAGEGSSDFDGPLSLLRRALKYNLHSSRSSFSLDGADPSLFLTLGLGFVSFPEISWMIFHVVSYSPLGQKKKIVVLE